MSSMTCAANLVAPTPSPVYPGRVSQPPAIGAAEERAEPGAGVDYPAPGVRERDAFELRERREEVRRQASERLRAGGMLVVDPPAVVVDGVVPAPQDPVVASQPEVMELVPQIGGARRSFQPRLASCVPDSGSVTRA